MADGQRTWRVAVGADNAGYAYKEAIRADLEADPRVEVVRDFGVAGEDDQTAYPHVGLAAGEAIARGEVDRAVLVCGTGIGVALSANKVPGVRATPVSDSFSAERSVKSNDCQVITFGQRVIGLELARRLVREWLGYEFDTGSPSADKVAVLRDYETGQGGTHE